MQMDDLKTIWYKLKQYDAPQNASAEGWCYDQLLGAAFALEEAAKVELPDPNAFKCYRGNVGDLCSEDTEAYKKFAWGFYLNSAINRIVWGCERLLRFVGQADDPHIYFPEVIKKASKKASKGPALNNVLKHFQKEEDGRLKNDKKVYLSHPATKDNILHVLRGRVNRQKHWALQTKGMPTRGHSTEGSWNKILAKVQYELAIHALSLLIDLYWESIGHKQTPRETWIDHGNWGQAEK
jgi:hypothetical protein